MLPTYAEAMAHSMVDDERYNVDVRERRVRRNIYIDDECDSS